MGLFTGKKGLVLGVVNDYSIAWAISQKLLAEGAEIGFTHLPGEKMERRVRKLADPIGAKLVTPCDVQKDEDIARVFARGRRGLRRRSTSSSTRSPSPRSRTSSARSSTPAARGSRRRWTSASTRWPPSPGTPPTSCPTAGAIATLTYFGGERVVSGYNMMGVCKAALDASVKLPRLRPRPEEDPRQRHLRRPGQDARRLGRRRGRQARRALRGRLAARAGTSTARRSARPGMFILSDLASGITGEILHVDCGYNIMGSPGRAIEAAREGKA